jgi:hypothetical protein
MRSCAGHGRRSWAWTPGSQSTGGGVHGFAQACSVLCDGAHQERSYYVPSSRIHVAETKHPSGAQRAALLLAEASTALSPGWSMWARDRPGIRCALHVVDGAPLVVPKMSARNGAAGGGRQVAKLRSIRPDRSRPLTTVRPGTAGSAPRFRNLLYCKSAPHLTHLTFWTRELGECDSLTD